MLGFQFPPPWPDETGFIAAAFALARTGSFFDAGLNPDRVVMWMPPGYMVLLASVFRVFGYSFAAVRWVSTCSCLVSLGLAGGLACRLTRGWPRVLAGWAVAVAFLSPFTLCCRRSSLLRGQPGGRWPRGAFQRDLFHAARGDCAG
jgi:4-amino-4-deoxy-L-arabinose transferase-like glycosyltransferase